MIVYNYDADLEVSDTCVRSSLLSWVEFWDARLESSAVRIDGNSQFKIEAVRKRRADCMSVERTCCSLVDVSAADAVWSRSLVSQRAEVCPSGGIVSADAADRGSRWSAETVSWVRTLRASSERSFAGTWVRQLGRWSPPRLVAGWSTSPHSSLPDPSPSPGEKPVLLVSYQTVKLCVFCGVSYGLSLLYSGILDRWIVWYCLIDILCSIVCDRSQIAGDWQNLSILWLFAW